MAEDYIPYLNRAFLEWAQITLTYAVAKPTVFNLPADTLPSIQIQLAIYNTVFQTARNYRRGKSAGVHGTELSQAFLAADLALVNDLANSAFDTKSPYVFASDEPECCIALYVCPHWENSKGGKGLCGKIIEAIVP